jgi:hypothetical protein
MPSEEDTSDPTSAPPLGVPHPLAGNDVQTADMREEFERLTRQVPRDPEAERAFIEGKIELIRGDPYLSDQEKERAIAELTGRSGR